MGDRTMPHGNGRTKPARDARAERWGRMFVFRWVFFFDLIVCLVVSLAASFFFATKVVERERYLAELIDTALVPRETLSDEDVAIRLSHAIFNRTLASLRTEDLDRYSRWESTSYFNVTTAVSLRYGGYMIEGHPTAGPCGTMTRALLNSLWKVGIPARKLQLFGDTEGKGGGHTMVEFFSEGRWRVISPSDSGFVWRRPDGEIATAEEIHDDPGIFAQVFARYPRYRYRFDRYGNIRWEKVSPAARKFFRAVLGEKRFENATTPRLYDKPRTLFLGSAIAASVFFAVAAYFVRPRRAARAPAAGR